MNELRTALQLLITVLFFVANAIAANQPALSDTSDLSVIHDCPEHTVKADPQAAWSSYSVFHLMPAEYQPENPRHHLTGKQAERLTAALDRDLSRAFSKNTSGLGAQLDVTPILTDVKKDNPYINAISLAAINSAVSFGRASVRYELVDNATGRLVGEVENMGNARPWNIYPWQIVSHFRPLGHSYIMLNRGAGALRKDVRTIQKRVPVPTSQPSVSAGN